MASYIRTLLTGGEIVGRRGAPISNDFLRHLLRQFNKDRYLKLQSSVLSKSIVDGGQFNGTMTRIDTNMVLSNGKSLNRSVFHKAPYESQFHNQLTKAAQMYQTEAAFYLDIVPALADISPQIHDIIPEILHADEDMTVMMNLEDDGFRMNPLYPQGQTLSHLKLCLETMALFHGLGYVLKKSLKQPLNVEFPSLNEHLYTKKNADFLAHHYAYGIDYALNIVKDKCNDKQVIDQLEQVKRHAFQITIDLHKPDPAFDILTHGDCWSNNFLFKTEGGKPVDARVLDFQLTRMAPASTDLVRLFYTSATHDIRQKHMNTLLEFYYKEFNKVTASLGHVNVDYTLGDLKENVNDRLPLAAVYGIFSLAFRYVPQEHMLSGSQLAEEENYSERFRRVFESTLQRMNTEENYRQDVVNIYKSISTPLNKYLKTL